MSYHRRKPRRDSKRRKGQGVAEPVGIDLGQRVRDLNRLAAATSATGALKRERDKMQVALDRESAARRHMREMDAEVAAIASNRR